MPTRDVVVAGASAGGVESLTAFVAGLPADLPAAVLVVMHLPSAGHSDLAKILDRAGPLPATVARDGDRLLPGRISVAVNDHHLLVKHDHRVLSRSPRQNRARPAVDALLRAAGPACGTSWRRCCRSRMRVCGSQPLAPTPTPPGGAVSSPAT